MSIHFIDFKAQYKSLQPQLQERIFRVLEHGQHIIDLEVKELDDKLQAHTGVTFCKTPEQNRHSYRCALPRSTKQSTVSIKKSLLPRLQTHRTADRHAGHGS